MSDKWNPFGKSVRQFMEIRDANTKKFLQSDLKRTIMGNVILRGFRHRTNDGLTEHDFWKTERPHPEWFQRYLEESGLNKY